MTSFYLSGDIPVVAKTQGYFLGLERLSTVGRELGSLRLLLLLLVFTKLTMCMHLLLTAYRVSAARKTLS